MPGSQPRLLTALSAFVLFAAAPALALSIKLTPTFDHPGAKIAVSGKGFGANAVIDIYFDTTDELVVTANARGRFKKHSFRIPADAGPGEHWVSAVERNDGRGAQKRFLVSASWAERGYDSRGRRNNPYETILSPDNVDRLGKLWVAQTASGIESAPAVVDGIVYLASGGILYALSVDGGAQLWAASINGAGIPESSPAVIDGIVYVGSGDGKVYAFDAKTGAAIWSVQTTGAIRSSPAVVNGVIYIGTEDGTVHALDAATGAILWVTKLADLGVASSPAVANGMVYVGTGRNSVDGLDADTGAIVWSAPTGGGILSSAATADGMVYIGSSDYYLYAFDAKTGATRWSAYTGSPVYSSPAVANDIVYVGSQNRVLLAFDARTGAPLWGASFGAEVYSSPTVANGVVYISSLDRNIYALDALTGAQLWSAPTGSIEYASPSISDGILYMGSEDQKLYAFALDGGRNGAYRGRHTTPPSFASLHRNFHLKPESIGRNP